MYNNERIYFLLSKNVLKKICGVLSVAGILAINISAFAFSAVPATNIPNEVTNTKVEMGRSNQDNLTPVIATNIPEEKMNTKVEMGRSNQVITPVIATNIPVEEIDTRTPFY